MDVDKGGTLGVDNGNKLDVRDGKKMLDVDNCDPLSVVASAAEGDLGHRPYRTTNGWLAAGLTSRPTDRTKKPTNERPERMTQKTERTNEGTTKPKNEQTTDRPTD